MIFRIENVNTASHRESNLAEIANGFVGNSESKSDMLIEMLDLLLGL